MTKAESDAITDAMRKMSHEEMLKVDPATYLGDCDRVDFTVTEEAHCNVPIPILETEDDELIREYIRNWEDDSVTDDGFSY